VIAGGGGELSPRLGEMSPNPDLLLPRFSRDLEQLGALGGSVRDLL